MHLGPHQVMQGRSVLAVGPDMVTMAGIIVGDVICSCSACAQAHLQLWGHSSICCGQSELCLPTSPDTTKAPALDACT